MLSQCNLIPLKLNNLQIYRNEIIEYTVCMCESEHEQDNSSCCRNRSNSPRSAKIIMSQGDLPTMSRILVECIQIITEITIIGIHVYIENVCC